jgi:DNA-binding transcriptional LysR family regulator
MELHQVRYFLAVASTLNFTRAAEQCNVTQPALTKGVQKLEQELGGELIHRERQLTQLTDLGKAVLPMLERILISAEEVRRRAEGFQRKEIAPLKIGLAPSISASLVLDPIAEIANFTPGLHVELCEGAAEKLIDLLLEGEINAAMVGDVQDIPARIDNWSLFRERYVAVLAPTHQLANRSSIGIDDLRETVLLERAGCDVAPKIQRWFFPEEAPHLGHCSGHDVHLQHMAAAGFGVILAPEHMPRLPTLKTIPLEGNPVSREVRLLAVQGRRYSPALDAFVKVTRLRDWSFEGADRRVPHASVPEVARAPASHDHDMHVCGQPLPAMIRGLTPYLRDDRTLRVARASAPSDDLDHHNARLSTS